MRPKVYVVDPDEAERESLRRLLGTCGLRAITFPSAESFLTRPNPGDPGCLVTEADLPGLGGLELLNRLRQEGVGLPVIVIARNCDVGTAVRAMRAGAVDFLEKPFVERVLIQRVLQVLARAEESRSTHEAA